MSMEFFFSSSYPLLQTDVSGMQSVAAGEGELEGNIRRSGAAGEDTLSVAGGGEDACD